MSYPKAIVIGAVLIAGAIALSTGAQANPVPKGKYQIVSGHIVFTDEKRNLTLPVMWRVNVETGQMVYCQSLFRSKPDSEQRTYCVGSSGLLRPDSY